MADRGTLIRAQRLAQINNGALVAAWVLGLGDEYLHGKLTRPEFVESLIAADLYAHNEAVLVAREFLTKLRALEGVDGVLIDPRFDVGAAYGRAIGTTIDLHAASQAVVGVERDWASEFRKIIEAGAVRADRIAKNAGREAVVASAHASGRAWRRVSDGNPCSFCAMLVSRGPAYTSPHAALTIVGAGRYTRKGSMRGRGRARGARGLGEKYHNHCGCTAVEVFGGWAPTPDEERLVTLYDAAVEKCETVGIPANAKNVQTAMRDLGNGLINDAHIPTATKPNTRKGLPHD